MNDDVRGLSNISDSNSPTKKPSNDFDRVTSPEKKQEWPPRKYKVDKRVVDVQRMIDEEFLTVISKTITNKL